MRGVELMMRAYLKYIFIFALVYSLNIKSMSGPIITQTISVGFVENNNAFWYSDAQYYTNGGLTFKLPGELFFQTPNVTCAIALNQKSERVIDLNASTINYVITSISNSEITIKVYIVTDFKIVEADTDQVIVHVWAVGTQY